MVSIWLLVVAVVVALLVVAAVPRLRQRPPRAGDRTEDPSGRPTLGRDPDGPPAP